MLPPLPLLLHSLQHSIWEAWVRGLSLLRCIVEEQGWGVVPFLSIGRHGCSLLGPGRLRCTMSLLLPQTASWSSMLHLGSLRAATQPSQIHPWRPGMWGMASFSCLHCSPPLHWGDVPILRFLRYRRRNLHYCPPLPCGEGHDELVWEFRRWGLLWALSNTGGDNWHSHVDVRSDDKRWSKEVNNFAFE